MYFNSLASVVKKKLLQHQLGELPPQRTRKTTQRNEGPPGEEDLPKMCISPPWCTSRWKNLKGSQSKTMLCDHFDAYS